MMKQLRCNSAALALCVCFVLLSFAVQGQCKQNMQGLYYTMDIHFNAAKNNFSGYQKLIYQNDSPDTLVNLFYHLFYNAFQPGSQMENRAHYIRDQENIYLKIQNLKNTERGFEQIDSLKINGAVQDYGITGTILKINPSHRILPGAKVTIELWFKSQIPEMIVRTGRNNPERVAFTMTQWYPKMAAYDRAGWHADEYIRREFYGGFANYDVTIQIDSAYTVAATGVLQNPEACGHGYATRSQSSSSNSDRLLSWHFRALNVHDFAWAADSSYIHTQQPIRSGLDFHCFYKKETATPEDWQNMPEDVSKIFGWMETKVGPYPYPVYSLVQGGSGGTEYPMLSMILGKRPVSKGLIKGYPVFIIALHEIMHNWWYAAVANDETRNAWLDEGFALFFQYEYMDELNKNNQAEKAIRSSYEYLKAPMKINALEPMTTPSDYYDANWSYDASVYHKGAVFLNQLRYITGDDLFWKGIRDYYSRWTFGHPDGDDFILCMEKASGMQLKWYLDLWTKTNKTIDYAIGDVQKTEKGTTIQLLCKGDMPMPSDVRLTLTNGSQFNYTIPLVAMYGHKKATGLISMAPWGWTDPMYLLAVPYNYETIDKIEIDPEKKLMDLKPENNSVNIRKINKIKS
jgi:hypothetical protein